MMKKYFFVMLCLSMVVGLAGADILFQPTGDPFSSGLRNNFSGQLGFLFGTAGQVEVAALGFFDEGEDGLAVDHQVRLYEWFKTTTGEINLVAEVTVSAGTDNVLSDGFRWAELSEPVTIESQELGHWYILATTHAASDGDWFYDFDWTYANTGFDFNSSIMNTGIWYDARWGSSTAAEDPPLGGAYNGSAYYTGNLSTSAFGGAYGPGVTQTENGAVVDAVLAWKAGPDPNKVAPFNPAIKKHYVYLSEDQNDSSDPNLYYHGVVDQVSTTDPNASISAPGLNFDGLYLWQVEEGLDDGLGGVYPAGDPNNILGSIWSFETVKTLPVIVVQPEDVLVNLNDPALISISVSSISDLSYQWYKSADNANDTSGDDTPIGTDADTLSFASAAIADEGFYYCEVTNDGGTVISDVAKLGVKRLMAYWTLDGLVADQYVDSSTEDPVADNADPNNPGAIDSSYFVAGPYSLGTASAVAIDDNSFGTVSTSFHPTQYSNQLTVSVWIRLTSLMVSNGLHGIVSEGTGELNDADNFLWSLSGRNRDDNTASPAVRLISWNGLDAWSAPASIELNEWTHVVATVGDGNAAVYVNGLPSGYGDTTPVFGNKVDAPVRIGDFGPYGYTFPGEIDDVKVYNYGMTALEVVDLYHDVSGINLCVGDYASDFDVANSATGLVTGDEGFAPDCKINLNDFAALASGWLSCGLYPSCP